MIEEQLARKYISKITSAKQRGLEFTLSIREYKKLLNTKTCYYTGIKFSDVETSPFYRTLERLDNSIGYTKENTVAACHCYNALKAVIENPTNGCTMEGTIAMLSKLLQPKRIIDEKI